MNETQLAIVISVINNAATQLAEVGDQLSSLGVSAEGAAATIQSSLTAAEEQIIASAEAAADQWAGATDSMAADVAEFSEIAANDWSSLVEANQAAAEQVAEAWAASSKAMEDDLAAALATAEEDTSATADKVQSTAGSMHGYFRALIAAYALERGGEALLGGVEGAVTDAAKSGSDSAKQYDDAVNKLSTDWQTFMATQGSTLLPLLTQLATAIDGIVEKMTAWHDAHPQLTEAMLIFMGVLGGLMIAIGTLIAGITVLGIIVAVVGATLGAAFVAWGAVVAVVIAAAVALIATNWDWIRDQTEKLITDFEGAWNALATWWTGFWNGIYNALETVWGKIQTIINEIQAATAKVTGAVSGVAGAIGSSVSGVIGGAIHAFATGGIVNGPTLALVGEAGPEAIIPLSAFAGGSGLAGGGIGGGGGINITITGNTISSQLDVRNLAQTVGAEIVRVLRLNNKLSI